MENKFIFIIILNIIIKKFYNDECYLNIYYFANITLKIKGIGIKNVLSNYFNKNYYPDEISINGIKQNEVSYNYNFNKTDNFVELSWNNNRINCENMFNNCPSIYEINFANFDTSQVRTMKKMFLDCTLLT
jgi:surface protein